MATQVPLTQLAVNRLTAAFGGQPNVLNGLLSAAQTSPYLAGLVNTFVAKGGAFAIGQGKDSNAADTSPDGDTIFIGSSLLPSSTTDAAGNTVTTGNSPTVLATLLGHELGHALLPGGMGDVNGPSTNPDQAAANGMANEGVALTSEYIVATQLGLNGSGIIPQLMYSDQNSAMHGQITASLNQIAQSEGVNVSQLTYGSSAMMAFAQANTAATSSAANLYDTGNPSVAPYLTYYQYYADAWIINNCSGTPVSSVDWSKVTSSMVATTITNSNGTCSISVSGIPLLQSAGGGTTPAISGTLSAPVINADGTQTSTFTNMAGQAVSALLFGPDGAITTKIYSPGTTTLIEENTTGADGLQLVDATVKGSGSISSMTEQNGKVTVNASGATVSESDDAIGATISGNSDTINAGSNSITALYGTGGIVNFVANSGALLNLYTANASAAVAGGGNTVAMIGAGTSVSTSGNTINFAAGINSTVTGSGNTLNEYYAGDIVTLYGINNVIGLTSNSSSYVNFGANATGTMTGTGDTLNMLGSGTSVNTSSNTINFASGINSTVTGSGNTLNEYNAGDIVTLYGINNVIGLTSNSSSYVNFGANATGTVTGTGDILNMLGGGTSVSTSSNTINFASGINSTVTGGGNTLNEYNAGDIVTLYGINNVIGLSNKSTSCVNFGANATGTVTGTGDTINLLGNGTSVSTSSNTINFASGINSTVTGSGNILNEFNTGDIVTLYGINNVVGLTSNSNSYVNFGANATGTVTGTGDTLNMLGSGTSVSTSSNTINFASGINSTVTGSGNILNEYNASDYVTLYGVDDVIHMSNNSGSWAFLEGGASGTVTGSGDTVALMGNGASVKTSGNTIDSATGVTGASIDGSSDIINGASGFTTSVTGGGDTVNLNGTGDVFALISGSNYTVNGYGTVGIFGAQSDNINLTSGDALLYGTSGQFYRALQYNNSYLNDAINFNGSQETDEEFYNASGQETEQAWFNGGSYAYQIADFSGGMETEQENFNTASGALTGVDLWNGSGPYAYEEEFSNGGAYFDEIETFNSTTGTITGGAMFNSQTGAETEWYNNGAWYSGSSGMSDDSDDGWDYDDDYAMDDDDWSDDDEDPVILNLNGGKVETTATASSPANFDINDNGQAIRTAWGTAGEGYLVYDPNDPGNTAQISRGGQLISGMGALQNLAQSADGSAGSTLTANDALWNDLKVWVDTTGTGQFQSGQLYSLGQLGIASLDLNGVQVNRYDNGNEILEDSSFTWANGTTGDMAGVGLAVGGSDAANSAEAQVQKLVAAMASFGADTSTGSVSAAQAQNEPHMLLVANAH